MKVYNTYFTSSKALKTFLTAHNIKDTDSILMQIFTGICDEAYIKKMVRSIKKLLPTVNIIGATTDGEIYGDKVSEKQTVLSLMVLESTHVRTHLVENAQEEDLAERLYEGFENREKIKLLIVFSDGLVTNGEIFMKKMSMLNKELTVAGGLAGDNGNFVETFVFTQEGIGSKTCVGAAFYGDDLIINTDYNFGWESIGNEMTVTSAQGNVVHTIDHMPAKMIYGKYLGDEVMNRLPVTGVEFPLIIKRGEVQVARAVIGVDAETGSLIFGGGINTGDKVQFGYGNIEAIISDNTNRYININNQPVEALYIYSCMARKRLIGASIVSELTPLSLAAPMSGFFTYGEMFHNQKTQCNEFLNETMTVLSLSETTHARKTIEKPMMDYKTHHSFTVRALSNLVHVTSKELKELNESLEEKVQNQVRVIKEKQSQLIQQSRHASMGEMIGMIAHQWRQPLSAISASVGLLNFDLLMDALNKDEVQKHIDLIGKHSQFLSTTIDDFRNFFKENKEKSITSLKNVVEETLTILRPSIEHHGVMIIQDYQCHAPLETYPNELKQVVLNLIKNATDNFLDKKIKDPTIWIKVYKQGDSCLLEVADNGGGIDPEIMAYIFEPYFTTKEKKDGTGLGLYMSKTIIEEHCGGKIEAANSAKGAVFTISLYKST